MLDNALDAIDQQSLPHILGLLRAAADNGMRVIELSTSAPRQVAHIDEALIEESEGWIRVVEAEGLERLLHWGLTDLKHIAPRPPMENIVMHAERLTFHYDKSFSLHAPQVSVRGGEILWIVGPNGAGKTTLLKRLALLLRPQEGRIQLHRGAESLTVDFVGARREHDSVHRFVLYQFQEPDDQIYGESVHDELVATARQCHGIDEYLVHRRAHQLGLSNRLHESPWDLSRSARRLLTLGSVLCATPAVALLDEPTVELDAREKLAIATALFDFTDKGGACVVVSHDSLFMEAICSRRIEVRDGRVAVGQ